MSKSGQTIFVTGATGFLGGHFLKSARAHCWKLRCLTRNPPSLILPNAEWVKGNLSTTGRWKEKLKGCSIIVHLATCPLLECERSPQKGCEIIIGGINRLFTIAEVYGIKRIILASTAEVYGSPKRLPITESTHLQPLSVYGFFKACADLYALKHAETRGLSLCILRFFNLYGRAINGSLPSNVLSLFAQRIIRGKSIILHASFQNSRDFLHVQDAARALLLAIHNKKAEGIINIGSGKETTLQEAARQLSHLANQRFSIDFRPNEGRLRCMVADTHLAYRVLNFKSKVSLEFGLREVLDGASDSTSKN